MSEQENKFPPSSRVASETGGDAPDTRAVEDAVEPAVGSSQLDNRPTVSSREERMGNLVGDQLLSINPKSESVSSQLDHGKTVSELARRVSDDVADEPRSINPETELVSCEAQPPKNNDGYVEIVVGSKCWPGEVLGGGTKLLLRLESTGGEGRGLPDPKTNVVMEVNN